MKIYSPAKRAFDKFKKAQREGDKSSAMAGLRELDEIFSKELPELTLKQRKFCQAFVGEANGNGVEAARLAGYKGNDLTLRVVASENLTKLNIQDCIRQLRAEAEKKASGKILTAIEVLVGLTKFALADPAEVFEVDGSFDLKKAQERGASRLIKTVSFDKDSGKVTKVELYNAQQAHVDLGKYHKLFTDKVEFSGTSLDSEIEQRLEELAAGSQAGITGEAESETIN
jgi:phage terminase small subunit